MRYLDSLPNLTQDVKMDWLGLGKHLFNFGFTSFDIGSDIANSLNFLGVFNNDKYTNITSISFTNLTYPITSNPTMPLSVTNEMNLCPTIDQREDYIWGMLSLGIVFLPGIIWSSSDITKAIYNRNWRLLVCWIILQPMLSLIFPLALLFLQFGAILLKCFQFEVDQEFQLQITRFAATQSSIESTFQLLLQLFTLLNGYQSTLLQKVAIVTSFFQIGRCSVLNDIETKINRMGGKELSFKESLLETIYRLPLYSSTIIFRIGSLCLTMAYLRYFSLIPIAILVVVQSLITWKRCKKLKNTRNDTQESLYQTVQLVVANIGVIKAYGMHVEDPYNKLSEDEKDVAQFIKHSTIASFLYHTAILMAAQNG